MIFGGRATGIGDERQKAAAALLVKQDNMPIGKRNEIGPAIAHVQTGTAMQNTRVGAPRPTMR
jgi:hypothetical protein